MIQVVKEKELPRKKGRNEWLVKAQDGTKLESAEDCCHHHSPGLVRP